MSILLEHIHQVIHVNLCERLVSCDLSAVPSVMTGRHENTLRCTFRNHCAVKIPDRGYGYDHVVPFCLDDEFSPTDWVWVKGNRINAPISTCLSYSNLATRL